MWFRLTQFRVGIDGDESRLLSLVAGKLGLPVPVVKNLKIQRKSLDARYKELSFVYTLIFECNDPAVNSSALLEIHPNLEIFNRFEIPSRNQEPSVGKIRPVIVGAGPAGLFAGLRLAAAGWAPVIIERGDGLLGRIGAVDRFWKQGKLDPESNIQYGIGGAGTFSDGKLTTRIKDPQVEEILETLVRLGAPPDILYWQYPHIGTDLLRNVVENLQNLIKDYGGEVRFRARLTDLHVDNSRVTSIQVNGNSVIDTDCLVLATGNSARDIYSLLFRKGFKLEAKAFAVGLRIEHPQEVINKAQYGRWAEHPKLGPAEYHLTYKHQETGRGVYTFCMCPGGRVVGATSGFNQVVTNGMSYHVRDSGVANAAIVATVSQNDFGAESPLAGVRFQEDLEGRAFQAGGSNYFAPVQRWGDFMKKQPSTKFGEFKPSYLPGATAANLWDVLPEGICRAISEGILYFGKLIRGFDWPEAVLTGVETRTSAPVRVVRDERRETEGIGGVYPTGEGAGYAGGIVSSALDGWKTAEAILERYQ
jgi:uncharacterized protein